MLTDLEKTFVQAISNQSSISETLSDIINFVFFCFVFDSVFPEGGTGPRRLGGPGRRGSSATLYLPAPGLGPCHQLQP